MVVKILSKIPFLPRLWFKPINAPVGKFFLQCASVAMVLVVVGILANVLVIEVNQGKMPVVEAPTGSTNLWDDRHQPVNMNTKLVLLSDWIAINAVGLNSDKSPAMVSVLATYISFPLGISVTASPGDVFMWVFGLFSSFLVIVPLISSIRWCIRNLIK